MKELSDKICGKLIIFPCVFCYSTSQGKLRFELKPCRQTLVKQIWLRSIVTPLILMGFHFMSTLCIGMDSSCLVSKIEGLNPTEHLWDEVEE